MTKPDIPTQCDCLIVGGGPAGLTAAIYLARFHLRVTVIDGGQSRAELIPLTRNHAGFPEGISGRKLLTRMREQAALYGAALGAGDITALSQIDGGFRASIPNGSVRAKAVLLATGVVNRRPPMLDEASHDRALAAGLLRYCAVCDAYEVTDRKVAVMGTGGGGCAEALFLRSYTKDVTLVAPEGEHRLTAAEHQKLAEAGVALAGPCRAIALGDHVIELDIGGVIRPFDTLYPALGSAIRSGLAGQLGARLSGDGCIMVDAHQRTNVPGLYAAGDVVLGLDQISHAMGEGGVAATTIRNDLAQHKPLLR